MDGVLSHPDKPHISVVFFGASSDRFVFQHTRDEFFAGSTVTSGRNRQVGLLATMDAPYSTPDERQSNPSPRHVLKAISYLFNDGKNTLSQVLPRYAPKVHLTGTETFNTVFINDVTRILHCEIPNHPEELSVRAMYLWLSSMYGGKQNGWQKTLSGTEAQRWVNQGGVAVMVRCANLQRSKASDHIALVRPNYLDLNGAGDPFYPLIAQAGLIVSPCVQSTLTFRDLMPIEYFLHV